MLNRNIYGFGIIGTGVIADFHARAISEINNAKLIGVYNHTKSKADNFAHKYSCNAYNKLTEMLADKEIDIVCICTPSGAHLEPALASIAAGKHCMIEKPLEITVERCNQIIEAAAKAGAKIEVVFPSRFYDASQKLKKALEENRFGDLVLGDAYVKWYRSSAYYQSGEWRGTRQLDGGGALMNQGIHSVDLLQWFMGPVKSVQAIRANIKHKNIEVEDTIVAIVEFTNGALGTIECSTAVYPGAKKRMEVKGTRGSAVMEEEQITEWKFKEEKEEDTKEEFHNKDISALGGASDPAAIDFKYHQRQIEDMIKSIEKNEKPAIGAEEGRKSVAIIEAIYKSAEKGEKVIL